MEMVPGLDMADHAACCFVRRMDIHFKLEQKT
jgi:hypothetical protein